MSHLCSVLLVEDDDEQREMLRIALTTAGYDVATARNGRHALDHLRSTTGTCVLVLDLLMPVMDGVQFRAAQRRDRSLAWLPVVIISGALDAAQTAVALDARGFVRKPIDIDRLLGAVAEAGCRRRAADG
jgi:DNA-binding NtrC family response regulator